MENSPQNRVISIFVAVFVAFILIAGACSAGFVAGRLLPNPAESVVALAPDFGVEQVTGTLDTRAATPEELQDLFVPFWQAWQLVHDQYVDQPVDDQILMRGAIRGMLDSLEDPHTSYIDPESYKMLNTALKGEDTYEGIGAWVDTTADYLTIISPMPGSPAQKAGLRTGDKIIAINGEDMTGVDGEAARKLVIGPAGTSVSLTIQRGEQAPFTVDVERANITVPSIESRTLEDNIGYVHILIFADDTKEQLRETLKTLLEQEPVGIILDLRGNGGGLLTTAVEVSSEFLDQGVVLYEEYGDGTRRTFDVQRGGLATEIPLVVLVNEGSASASEIVAGAIQDYGRAQLVGTTTFGKGSVQVPTALKDDAGAVRITIARWLTPNGRTINEVGLTPDVEVQVTEDDLTADRDPQLDKAIELLLSN